MMTVDNPVALGKGWARIFPDFKTVSKYEAVVFSHGLEGVEESLEFETRELSGILKHTDSGSNCCSANNCFAMKT